MRIAIDTAPLSGGHTNRGVGGYTRNLIEALKTYQSGNTYLLFDSGVEGPPQQAEIIHFPFFDPFILTLPLMSPKPTIVTVHDLIPIIFPKAFPKGIRGSLKWEIQKYSLKRKQRILTDSECSKKDIARITGIPDDTIDVVYLAPSLPKYTGKDDFTSTKKQYRIPGDYFLYVGDVNWNKNVIGLLRAFSSFTDHHLFPMCLVLVGKAFLDTTLPQTREINAIIADFNIEDRIIRTGYIDEKNLSLLYKHAHALIQPSLYEGFGFPVLDALSMGCPVICSSSASLLEIAGPSIMVDVSIPSSIVDGLIKISTLSKEKRRVLIKKGFEWVHRFTWEKVARDTVASYEKVLGKK